MKTVSKKKFQVKLAPKEDTTAFVDPSKPLDLEKLIIQSKKKPEKAA